jgi:hypothetical protein
VKDSPKEKARQRIVRAIFHEYGFSPNGMEFFFLRKDIPVSAEEYRKFRQKHLVPGV